MTKNIGFRFFSLGPRPGQFHRLWVGSWLDCDMCYGNNSTSHLARVTHYTWLPKIGRNMPVTLFIIDTYVLILEIEKVFDFATHQL